MQAVYRTIESVARSRASIFITGESGTGKELAAEAVHKVSGRHGGFVALNCGAIPRDLLESEIFGHVKGAFTGATDTRIGAARQADGGTLFLDEIGEMPLEMQVKLLRFVQTGTFQPVGGSKPEKVDVRFVCATNRDPLAEVEAGRFREDLYYRLYVVPIELPPLRVRDGDPVLIARHFLKTYAKEERKRFRIFEPEAEAAIRAYPWPGNVRQLQNAVRNAVVMHDAERLEAAMLPAMLLRAPPRAAASMPPVGLPAAIPQPVVPPPEAAAAPAPASAEPEAPAPAWTRAPMPPPEPLPRPAAIEIQPLWQMEKRLIMAALEQTQQDVPRAASLLEINPSTIYRKLQAWRAAETPES
jgi:two-component system repressor protein LuxO